MLLASCYRKGDCWRFNIIEARDKQKNPVQMSSIMDIKTHLFADRTLLGTPIDVIDGESAVVRLVVTENMIVDDMGLAHGGFTFGLADYAAMLAVNDPNVVIGGASVRFTAPVKRGDIMKAVAKVVDINKSKRIVQVDITVSEETVFTGELICYVLRKHVLEP